MTSSFDADVVVIGAGLGGLSAARHLQLSGFDVVVVEHHSKPGGYAHFFRKEDFRFEVALHALDGLGRGGWARPMFDDLGLLDRVEFNQLDPFYTVRFPDFEIDVPTDVDRYLERFGAVFPDEVAGASDLFATITRIGHDVAAYSRDRSRGYRPTPEEMLERHPDMAAAFSSSWEVFVDRFLTTAESKALVSALWGYMGLPPSQLSAGQFALTLLSYHTAGAWYPTGGSGAMSWALTELIEESGGAVHLRNTVTGLHVEPDSVVVATDKDLVVRARAVVSNASPMATVELAGDGAFDPSWVGAVRDETPSLSSLVVHLGLERDLVATGWPHHEFIEAPGYDLEAEYEAICDGRFSEAGMILSNYSATDPTCAPEGCSVLALTALAPWDHNDVWGTGGNLQNYRVNPDYLAVKEAAGQILIDRADALIPGLEDSIVTKHVGTPLTNMRYVRQPGGSLYGREQTVANQLNRRRPSTPLSNVFLAGAWVGGGGMTAAIGSGKSAARAAARYLESA